MKKIFLLFLAVILLFACLEISLRLCDIVALSVSKIYGKTSITEKIKYNFKTIEIFNKINKSITKKASQIIK